MNQQRLIRLLLTPSLLSGFSVFVGAIIVLAVSGWAYISRQQLFYDALFGPFGVATAMLRAPDFFAVFRTNVLNNPLTYDAMILVCAILIGFLVFTILESLGRIARESSVLWYEFHTHSPEARSAMFETLVRLMVRCISFAAWVTYVLVFVAIMLPFCILLLQAGIDALGMSQLSGAGACLLALAYLTVSLHVHIVLIRLSVLRPRLFGGWAVEEVEEA